MVYDMPLRLYTCIFSRCPQKIIGESIQLVDGGSFIQLGLPWSTAGLERNPLEGENSPKFESWCCVEIQQWKMISGGAIKERKGRKGWDCCGNWRGRLQPCSGTRSEPEKSCCCPLLSRM
jgi:hypothetical protein